MLRSKQTEDGVWRVYHIDVSTGLEIPSPRSRRQLEPMRQYREKIAWRNNHAVVSTGISNPSLSGGYKSIGAKGDARVERISVYNLKNDCGKKLEDALRPYVLSVERLKMLGYPIRYENAETYVYIHPRPTKKVFRPSSLSVDAVEFVLGSPSRSCDTDSGKSSCEEDEVVSRVCARCDETFFVTADGDEYGAHYCRHHWGRLNKEIRYECCNGFYGTLGCNSRRYHVWTGTTPGVNGPLGGYVQVTKCRGGVYGIDTEMCYTTAGLELAQVAIVSWDGTLVYSAVVKPTSPIVDYNTRFSGLRRRDITRATKTLRDVQDDILKFVGYDTILVGHALDNDLRALKLVHGAVVDTCDLYPHRRGFPFRRSLRELTMEKFGREIQSNKAGHSPTEDAVAAMDLVLLRIKDL